MAAEAALAYAGIGAFLGLVAGVSPGPLLALVVRESLRHGARAGLRVAIAPLITDAPVVVASYFLIDAASDITLFAGLIALAGAGFLVWLGIESVRVEPPETMLGSGPQGAVMRGITVNALNPNLYLHWATVGGPLLHDAIDVTPLAGLLFLVTFYALVVGTKSGVAAIVARSRGFFQGPAYLWTNRVLGVLLLLFAARFLYRAYRALELLT